MYITIYFISKPTLANLALDEQNSRIVAREKSKALPASLKQKEAHGRIRKLVHWHLQRRALTSSSLGTKQNIPEKILHKHWQGPLMA